MRSDRLKRAASAACEEGRQAEREAQAAAARRGGRAATSSSLPRLVASFAERDATAICTQWSRRW